jgi:hypothetical protein
MQMRRERPAFDANLDELFLKTLQASSDQSGYVSAIPRQIILPTSSMTQIAVCLPPTSNLRTFSPLLSYLAGNHWRKAFTFRRRAATSCTGCIRPALTNE